MLIFYYYQNIIIENLNTKYLLNTTQLLINKHMRLLIHTTLTFDLFHTLLNTT